MLHPREVDEKYKKVKAVKDGVYQHDYEDDPKRTVRRLSVASTPMCAIPPAEGEQFWAGRWSQNPDFDYEQVNQLYPIKREFDETMDERVIMQLLDLESYGRTNLKAWQFICPWSRWNYFSIPLTREGICSKDDSTNATFHNPTQENTRHLEDGQNNSNPQSRRCH
jgi:hypothetical protein